MRGDDRQQEGMFSYLSPEARVPQDHPLRVIRSMVDAVLHELSPTFAKLYRRLAAPRSRRRNCCGPCCCRCSSRCAVSGS